MRKRLKRAIVLLFSALAALLMLVGCELGMTKEQALDAYNAKASVTYYANGGDFGNGNKIKELWYQSNSRPLNIGVDAIPSGTTITLKYDKHDFAGWYHVLEDEDGNPIVDEETGICQLDMERPVDFSTAVLQEEDAWYLGALWTAKAKVRVRLVSDGVITDKDGVTFDPAAEDVYIQESDYVPTNDFKTELRVDDSPIVLPADSAYTFVGYYFDKEATQPIVEELRQQEGQTEDVVIYAKYISSEYTVVKTATAVKQMFGYLRDATKKYYIARDIDMSSTTGIPFNNDLAATVEGNGFTIRNLTFTRSSVANSQALFKTVTSTAVMKNLTLENVSFDYKVPNRANIYFVFQNMESGATIANVTLSGVMNISGPSSANVDNLMNGYDNCLFGGFEIDAAYTEANPNGFKVLGNPEDFINISMK